MLLWCNKLDTIKLIRTRESHISSKLIVANLESGFVLLETIRKHALQGIVPDPSDTQRQMGFHVLCTEHMALMDTKQMFCPN